MQLMMPDAEMEEMLAENRALKRSFAVSISWRLFLYARKQILSKQRHRKG